MAGGWFGRKPAADRSVIERIRAWAAAAHAGDGGGDDALGALATGGPTGLPEAHFSVNEIICRDPGCPGVETVILVMQPGARTRAVKLAKAMAEVTEQDVRAAMAAPDPA